MEREELLHRLRHSASHVMAEAVVSYVPYAKLAIGPPIEGGFYYDFGLPFPLSPDDLESIERMMADSIAADHPFVQTFVSKDEARERFADQPYKLEIIEGIEGDTVSLYTHGPFTDLCEGPHVASTGELKAVRLLSLAGAYWRGDEHRPMLQRIYGTAWDTQEALDAYVQRRFEAERRDHRRLGRELDLFFLNPIAPASPFFLPKGAIVYNLLVEYVRGLYRQHGYQEVITPQLFDAELWRLSGHYDNYKENMFFLQVEEREMGLKPMNCPSHALMYAADIRSYRDLPIRYADFGRLHRNERSGVVHGLTRVRSLSQDDAHIFCRPDQIQDEMRGFLEMLNEAYRLFGFGEVKVYLSLRPDKRVGSDEVWERAEATLEAVLEALGLPYSRALGEGAFYGPKVDFNVEDALGREWQLGTAQLDFSLPERFELDYITDEGRAARPVIIHRAMLGSLERFLGILIEHTAGAFPVWLAPVQAVVIPIADRHNDYGQRVAAQLKESGFRVHVDDRKERMQAKIRQAQLQKVPYMAVVGDREAQEQSVSLRLRDGGNRGDLSIDAFIAEVRQAVQEHR
ncbi:MAG TPA: threonine--tRNA ligase [Dehalococcoidia bacterium]|nr:threonine--tRNA ligase [Dehalococcoidia bacterium]